MSTGGLLKPSKSREKLPYQEATDRGLAYYVAAALPYSRYSDSNAFILGSGETTIGLDGQVFTNVKLSADTSYYYFIRAYSEQVSNVHIPFVCL